MEDERSPKAQKRSRFLVSLSWFTTSYIAGFVVNKFASIVTDKTWLLLLLVFEFFLVALALSAIAKRLSLCDDGRTDAYESNYVRVFDFAATVLALMMPQFIAAILSEAVDLWPHPAWYEVIPLTAVLFLVVVVAVSTYIGEASLTLDPASGSREDDADADASKKSGGAVAGAVLSLNS